MNYPFELQRREAAAIRVRRQRADPPAAAGKQEPAAVESAAPSSGTHLDRLPPRTVGLALSGGGLQAAPFSLGILQAFAKKERLRHIDFLSSVSCGGYMGSFLGRLFSRSSIVKLVEEKGDPCARVESILARANSPQIQWLRQNAKDMVNAAGWAMGRDLAVKWGNLVAIYFVLGLLGLALFGLLRLVGDWAAHIAGVTESPALGFLPPFNPSPWCWLPLAALGGAVIPCAIAYWLAPRQGTHGGFSLSPVAAWVSVLALLGFSPALVPDAFWVLIAIVIALLAAVWLELARRRLPPNLDSSSGEASADPALVIRNRLAFGLGESLNLLLVAVLWATVDTLARAFARGEANALVGTWALIVVLLIPFLPRLATFLQASDAKTQNQRKRPRVFTSASFQAGIIAFSVAGLLVILVDGAVHWLFDRQFASGFATLLTGAVLSLIFGSAFDFLNYSSIQNAYGFRISRVFLGASNPARVSGAACEEGRSLRFVHPEDDIPFRDYHPEVNGGPLQLIGLCVNQTVDSVVHRGVCPQKGLPMCIGPCGVSVGQFHGIWTLAPPGNKLSWSMRLRQFLDGAKPPPKNAKVALRAVPVSGEIFHVFQGKIEQPVCVESLSLGTWIATSAAASATGVGTMTSLSISLLLGLLNRRSGYWWNSGLDASNRPGSCAPSLWRKIRAMPGALFKVQSLFISDFLGHFPGPAYRFWKISDGGRFDNTGIYELLRRRIPLIVAVDASEDAALDSDDVAELVAQARIDFGAEVEFVDPPAASDKVPPWILAWLADPEKKLGRQQDIGKPEGAHAALAQVTYAGDQEPTTWILLLKASVTGDEPLDVISYKRSNPAFPNEPRTDQSFSETQWECYRALGEHVGATVLR